MNQRKAKCFSRSIYWKDINVLSVVWCPKFPFKELDFTVYNTKVVPRFDDRFWSPEQPFHYHHFQPSWLAAVFPKLAERSYFTFYINTQEQKENVWKLLVCHCFLKSQTFLILQVVSLLNSQISQQLKNYQQPASSSITEKSLIFI
jgi:hypothetical protein